MSEREAELSRFMKEKPKQDMSKVIVSPMPGTVISVAIQKGDRVRFFSFCPTSFTRCLLI